MTVLQAVLHAVAVFGFAGAGIMAYLYYEQFFAVETPPLEWWLLFVGFGLFALSRLGRLFVVLNGDPAGLFLLVAELAGAGSCCVAGFMLWNKVRL